ncbi:MAG: hypothetical protein F4Z97_06080 [Gammaproteobacteria bacterium]|nr:hypothetical protein [Gammaproteobacteria bacterium]
MRFLLDDCAASRTLCKTLADVGHDVLSVSAGHAYAAAEDLLALASEQHRIFVTKDKDFGNLVFVQHLPHPCVIRLVGLNPTEEAEVLLDVIENESGAIRDRAIIVVTRERIRIRQT